MTEFECLILVMGMAVVTYLPRMLPMAALNRFDPPPFVARLLRCTPCAVLSALIFPGAFTSPLGPAPVTAGLVAAFLLGLCRVHFLLAVVAGLAVTTAVNALF